MKEKSIIIGIIIIVQELAVRPINTSYVVKKSDNLKKLTQFLKQINLTAGTITFVTDVSIDSVIKPQSLILK